VNSPTFCFAPDTSRLWVGPAIPVNANKLRKFPTAVEGRQDEEQWNGNPDRPDGVLLMEMAIIDEAVKSPGSL
jgi:hypothetical protein